MYGIAPKTVRDIWTFNTWSRVSSFVFDWLLFSTSIALTAQIFGCRSPCRTPRSWSGTDLHNPRSESGTDLHTPRREGRPAWPPHAARTQTRVGGYRNRTSKYLAAIPLPGRTVVPRHFVRNNSTRPSSPPPRMLRCAVDRFASAGVAGDWAPTFPGRQPEFGSESEGIAEAHTENEAGGLAFGGERRGCQGGTRHGVGRSGFGLGLGGEGRGCHGQRQQRQQEWETHRSGQLQPPALRIPCRLSLLIPEFASLPLDVERQPRPAGVATDRWTAGTTHPLGLSAFRVQLDSTQVLLVTANRLGHGRHYHMARCPIVTPAAGGNQWTRPHARTDARAHASTYHTMVVSALAHRGVFSIFRNPHKMGALHPVPHVVVFCFGY